MTDARTDNSGDCSGPPGRTPAGKTFDTFVVSEQNRLAFIAATGVAESPGDAYNPLFMCGPAGVGKTHLLRAIAHHIELRHRQFRAIEIDYLTASYQPHRILLARPTDGDLLLISDRADARDDDRATDLRTTRTQQLVLTCRTVSYARAIAQAAGHDLHALIAKIDSPPAHHHRQPLQTT